MLLCPASLSVRFVLSQAPSPLGGEEGHQLLWAYNLQSQDPREKSKTSFFKKNISSKNLGVDSNWYSLVMCRSLSQSLCPEGHVL